MSQPEALRFFDWFLFDHELPEGKRLIELYAEERMADLSTAQQKIAADWINVGGGSLYELTAYEGQVLQLRDYFTGEESAVYEAGGRGNVELGELIITRLVPVSDRIELSTTAAYLPAAEITDVKAKIEAAKEAYLAEHPEASHTEFMRKHSHLLVHHALLEAKNQGRPPGHAAGCQPPRHQNAKDSPRHGPLQAMSKQLLARPEKTPLQGVVSVPGDKVDQSPGGDVGFPGSGTSHIRRWLPAGDTLATLAIVQSRAATLPSTSGRKRPGI